MPMQDLHTSQVYKCLEKKNLILGFEIIDLLILGLLLCLLNLLFSTAQFKFFYTFGPVGISAWTLRRLKSGKPDGYLMHLIQFYLNPGVVQAWPKAKAPNSLYQLQHRRRKNAKYRFE